MPTYDYRCRKCGHVFEVFHSMSDDTPRRCPECRSKAVKVPGLGAGILFKGSGFYITDYRSDSYQQKARQESPGGPADAPAGGGASKPETPRTPKAGSKPPPKKRGSAP
jgi:putative FmdB family regulatory protein